MWAVIFVWAILFIMIKLAFKFGSNPVINFLVMLVLFFGVLFVMRVSALWVHNRWHDTRPGLVRLLANFFYRQRQ